MRMIYAGHTDPTTLGTHYLPRNCADGQAAFRGHLRRNIVLDNFRCLTIPRNPSLWQCLPAKRQYEFERDEEFSALNQTLAVNRGRRDDEWQRERTTIHSTKVRLLRIALRKWQKTQPIKRNEPLGYHRAIFDRVRFMMPERDYLAQHMFDIDMLRSSSGMSVLNSMIALYRKSSIVEYRPGLEPDK